MSPYITLPPELLTDILADVVENYTGQPAFCSPAAYHLYDLATACRIFYVLIDAMAARKEDVRNDIEHLEKIKSAPSSYCSSLAFSPLLVLCRRIGWICSFCNNRSRRYADGPQGEIYTGLPVCQACEAFILPKISHNVVETDYHVWRKGGAALQNLREDVWKNLPGFFARSYDALYRWEDIDNLINEGSLRPRRCMFHNRRDDYSDFRLPWAREVWNKDQGFPPATNLQRSFLENVLPLHCGPNSYRSGELHGPILLEIALFREFLYQFDYSYCFERDDILSTGTMFPRYARIAAHWADHKLWTKRPWGATRFPIPPRCTTCNPWATDIHKKQDRVEYIRYQEECRKRRTLIRRYPGILGNPRLWCRLIENKGTSDDNEVYPCTGRRKSTDLSEGVPDREVAFELFASGDHEIFEDTVLLRVGKHLTPYRCYQMSWPRPSWSRPSWRQWISEDRYQLVQVTKKKVWMDKVNECSHEQEWEGPITDDLIAEFAHFDSDQIWRDYRLRMNGTI